MDPLDIYKLTCPFGSKKPLIFKNILKWKILNWDLKDWSQIFEDKKLAFRKIPIKETKEPIWETQCEKIMLTMQEFIKFQSKTPIDRVDDNYALYFDYKYVKDFQNFEEVKNEMKWVDLGHEIPGDDSTIWIGNSGSHTLCHQDTYGCNLIAQIYGRKEWILFSPETDLNATRVPYEESTVFSKLNLFCPDPNNFTNIHQNGRRIIVNPGDVLFLPNGWWHYVENLDTAISINTWIPCPEIDTKKHIEENLVSIFIQSLTKNMNLENSCNRNDFFNKIINPNSELLSLEESFPILYHTVQEFKNIEKTSPKDKNAFENDIVEILNANSDYVKIVEPLSNEDFQILLEEKCKRYNFEKNDKKSCNASPSSRDFIFENIVNAFCNPNNISRVANDLIVRF